MLKPRESRSKRLKPTSGSWTLLSLQLGRHLMEELRRSKENEENNLSNPVPIFSIPIMISYVRALAIEVENQRENFGFNNYKSELLEKLRLNQSNEILIICGFYRIGKEDRESVELLNQVRHEIIHPSPYPENGKNLPEYLAILDEKGLLWKPPMGQNVCTIVDYFCSHALMWWGLNNVIKLSKKILASDKNPINRYDLYFRPFFNELIFLMQPKRMKS